jgi:pyruvate-formate lyase-activating enzyme
MGSSGLQPQPDSESDAVGQFLTFVVPAPDGCNLKCAFCLVRQRREITETRLRPDDLARFIREAAERSPIFALAIQGYEPLLSESLPFTQAILATGRFLGLPTSMVTNGVRLVDALDLLKALSPSKIAISLDAASAEVHDRIRGVAGAWAATVGGIKRAVEVLAPRTRLAVESVLLPSKRHYLDAMPARLQEAASRAGVRLTVDDEFGNLGHEVASVSQPSLRALHVRTLPRNVEIFRLAPSGQCSIGDDILRQVTPETPRWQPGAMHAGDFLELLRGANEMASFELRSVAGLS